MLKKIENILQFQEANRLVEEVEIKINSCQSTPKVDISDAISRREVSPTSVFGNGWALFRPFRRHHIFPFHLKTNKDRELFCFFYLSTSHTHATSTFWNSVPVPVGKYINLHSFLCDFSNFLPIPFFFSYQRACKNEPLPSIRWHIPAMPGKLLPSFSRADIESHNTAKSCYVTLGSKVYDVTSFIDDHPGGGDLILEYAGGDVQEILEDPISHEHSEAAYEILDDCHIGFLDGSSPSKTIANGAAKVSGLDGVAERGSNGDAVYTSTGMSKAEDLSVETDLTEDYRTHKFLDLNRALFPQLWFGGFDKTFYLEQVHRPRHYKGGASAPVFGNFLEPLSKTPWWVIPSLWLPAVGYGCSLGVTNLSSSIEAAAYFLFGLFVWTLLEYTLHRCLFHIDKYVTSSTGIPGPSSFLLSC